MSALSSPGILDAIGRRISRLGGAPLTTGQVGSPGVGLQGSGTSVLPTGTLAGLTSVGSNQGVPINQPPSAFVLGQAQGGPLSSVPSSASLQPSATLGSLGRRMGARKSGGLGY